ncbi:hypothetical protein JOF28_001274 [Leucobacter exalbidus]|uniref:DUF222 domain-containing protein n=1 Tax=Leucobacter exalbidus TaxID=662960 RepID=A0A940T3D4_9MICO|nr:HNH endonuclease signature motif containing protein [Leucobacter exalbidus]MBP1326042.1 hypothetical protein [Leucobacter exalbidus]
MEIITSLEQQVAAARDLLEGVPEGESLPGFLRTLPDDGVLAVLEIGAALVRLGQRLEIPASGVVAQRSSRARGQTGIAQSQGHRDAASLLQQLTGVSRTQAARDVKVGQSLIEAAEFSLLGSASSGGLDGGEGGGDEGSEDGATGPEPIAAWHTALDRAADAGIISPDQYTAVRQGLGDPPTPTEADLAAVNVAGASELEVFELATAVIHETWAQATEQLLAEAEVRSLDELRKACRAVRDQLDPVGSDRRHLDRYEARSFRMWVDEKGTHRGSFSFDDETAAWLRSIIDSAMRPRRGGPRFLDPAERAEADKLRDDPRTNDQLMHDLVTDVMRGGTLALAEEVFGVRQAGVRIVRVVDTPSGDETRAREDHAFLEHEGTPVPVSVADRTICNTGVVPVTVDRQGNPLNVGREQRLFTSKQRIALSLRDGGCRWTNCDRPASYCEAHHIDEWQADQGHTDVARGILLCRYHHLELHNSGWRITRDGDGPFYLHRPGTAIAKRETEPPGTGAGNGADTRTGDDPETPIELPIRVIRAYAWKSAPQPSVRFRPGRSRPPEQVPPEAWGTRRQRRPATLTAEPPGVNAHWDQSKRGDEKRVTGSAATTTATKSECTTDRPAALF